MFNQLRKTIGLFICKLPQYYQQIICQTIGNEAERLGYHLAVFSTFGKYENNNEYISGERKLLELPPYEELDGLILCLDVFDIQDMVDILCEKVKKLSCPVISIRQQRDEFISILSNDGIAIEEMVSHLHSIHHVQTIYYVTGPKGMSDIARREQGYRKAMSKHQLYFDESYIYEGNLWTNQGKQIVDYFYQLPQKPEAIICANDYMAIAICEELNRRHIVVPSDVIVTGFDDIPEALNLYPQLTTVQARPEDFAMCAIKVMHQCLSATNKSFRPSSHYDIDTHNVYRMSCGCQNTNELSTMFRKISERNKRLIHLGKQNTFMVYRSEKIQYMHQLPDLVGKYIEEVSGVKDFYLCLNANDDFDHNENQSPFTSEMCNTIHAVFIPGNEVQVPMPMTFFQTKELLPKMRNNRPKVYYFTALHYQDHCFGYAAIAFEHNTYQENGDYDFYQSFIINITNVLERIYLQKQLDKLSDEKFYLITHDQASRTFNEFGLYNMTKEQLLTKEHDSASLCFLCVHINHYDLLHNELGSSECDNMLIELARLIQQVIPTDPCLTGRIMTDIFCSIFIYPKNYDLYSFNKEINQLAHKSFPSLKLSSGSFIKKAAADIGIEECIKNSLLKLKLNEAHEHFSSHEQYAAEASNIIKENYWKDIRVQDLADRIGITRSYLTTCFSEYYHTSVQNFIKDYRLLIASNMLLEKKSSIKEIAHQCGFTDELYFSKVFKTKYGMSPRKFRLQSK